MYNRSHVPQTLSVLGAGRTGKLQGMPQKVAQNPWQHRKSWCSIAAFKPQSWHWPVTSECMTLWIVQSPATSMKTLMLDKVSKVLTL
jgi:hypothetical protein